MKINKTNVARLLDKAKVAYQLVPYEVDENDLSATHVADQLGENVAQVFKTLVLHGDKSGYFVCVIPGADEVDLKKAAKVSGNKSCEMIPVKELLPLTGYIRGGCSPHRHEKAFPDLYPPHRRTVRSHLCQRRTTGLADPDRSGGFDPGGTSGGGGCHT